MRWDGKASCVQVRLVYTATAPDSTVFTIGNPGFGGQPDVFDVVSHIVGQAPDQVRVRPAQRQIAVYHHRHGFLYAFYLDNQIRLATTGRSSLRDCLLLRHGESLREKDPEAALSVADFTDAVAQFLPRAQVEQEFKRYILQGESLDFSPVTLVQEVRMRYAQQVPVLPFEDTTSALGLYR